MLTTIYILIFLIPIFGCLAVSSKGDVKENYEDMVELLVLVLFVMLASLFLDKYVFNNFM
jgi:hypothetical protein